MFKKTVFFLVFLFCSQIYGGEGGAPDPSPQVLLTYYEALEKYRESARLEWKLGMGFVMERENLKFLIPVLLEVQTPIVKENEKLKWLLQGGPMMNFSVSLYDDKKTSPLEVLLQTGLRYNFSNTFYGAITGGPVFNSFDSVNWAGGVLFGIGSNNLSMDMGVHFFSEESSYWSFYFSLGSLLKRWWVERE